MDLIKLQETILLLEEDKKELDKQKDAIDTVIVGLRARHGLSAQPPSLVSVKGDLATKGLASNEAFEKQILANDKSLDFPRKAPIRDQVVYLFRHYLKEANRYPEIQEAYNKAFGAKRYIRDEIMAIRREENPVLKAIKFNRNSNSTYTGLTEWIIEEDGQPRFHPDHFDLDGNKFPKGITHSEWAVLGAQNKENQKGHTEV